MVSAAWYKDTLNVGDNLTPFILSRFFNEEITFSSSSASVFLWWTLHRESQVDCDQQIVSSQSSNHYILGS